tara:strand:- start:497 stop:1201 length:705 start_codon:yes stop_codon:yes gene_type:complete
MNEALTLTDSLDVSIWGLILQADIVVRLVMFILLLLSIISWSIIFEKYTRLRRLNRKAESFENEFWSGMNIEKIHKNVGNNSSHPMEAIFLSGMKELNNSPLSKNLSAVDNQIIGNRIEKRMLTTLNKEVEVLEKNISFLATTGSAAPFIGLFGTVWGIMNSFQSIATAKNTSLTIVAPGIAEALLATAMGLLAAIPAVIAYNRIAADMNRYSGRLEIFLNDFSSILSRHINKK